MHAVEQLQNVPAVNYNVAGFEGVGSCHFSIFLHATDFAEWQFDGASTGRLIIIPARQKLNVYPTVTLGACPFGIVSHIFFRDSGTNN